MKRTWKRNRIIILEENRALNTVAMDSAGFDPDPGRTLTAEEIASLNLTDPREIRDCRANPQYIFRR